MFPITITIANTLQLNVVMAALLSLEAQAADTKEVAAAPVEKPKKNTPAATPAAPAPTQPTAEAVEAAAPEKMADASAPPAKSAVAAPPASTAATEATYQDAAAAITKLSRAKGRDAAVAVLQQFGAAKLPDVKPAQFADIIAAAEVALGA